MDHLGHLGERREPGRDALERGDVAGVEIAAEALRGACVRRLDAAHERASARGERDLRRAAIRAPTLAPDQAQPREAGERARRGRRIDRRGARERGLRRWTDSPQLPDQRELCAAKADRRRLAPCYVRDDALDLQKAFEEALANHWTRPLNYWTCP
ncbi:MAG TPA: hypothetical protein VGF94_21860 [Kofleriaceae bacterium]